MTALELLLVMGIGAMLFGFSIASLTRVGRGPAIDIAERQVRSSLGRARSSARQQSALCQLTFEPGGAQHIRLSVVRDAGSWSFNEAKSGKVLGGRNNFAILGGATLEDGGVVRRCASFDGNDEVRCDPNPGYDPSRGFDIRLEVYPDGESMGGPLASYGDQFLIELESDGSLTAQLDLDELPKEKSVAKTPPGVLVGGQWATVRVLFDGFDLKIYALGVAEAVLSLTNENLPGPLVLNPARDRAVLTFGGKGFQGRLDEILYRTVEEDELLPLAEGKGPVFGFQENLVVRFDSQGRLDPRFHSEALTIGVQDEDSSREVRVDLSGVIR